MCVWNILLFNHLQVTLLCHEEAFTSEYPCVHRAPSVSGSTVTLLLWDKSGEQMFLPQDPGLVLNLLDQIFRHLWLLRWVGKDSETYHHWTCKHWFHALRVVVIICPLANTNEASLPFIIAVPIYQKQLKNKRFSGDFQHTRQHIPLPTGNHRKSVVSVTGINFCSRPPQHFLEDVFVFTEGHGDISAAHSSFFRFYGHPCQALTSHIRWCCGRGICICSHGLSTCRPSWQNILVHVPISIQPFNWLNQRRQKVFSIWWKHVHCGSLRPKTHQAAQLCSQ